MNVLARLLSLLLSTDIFQRDTQICRKCLMMPGEGFCDRSLLGEPGACVFDVVPPCHQCGSKVPCFGLPCELADRIAVLRKDWKPR